MNNENTPENQTAEYAVVELMGHVLMVGRLSVEERFDGLMGRIDEPRGERVVTRYFNRHNIYRLTITDELTVRRVIEEGYFPDKGYFEESDTPIRRGAYRAPVQSANYFDDDGEDFDKEVQNFDDSDPFFNG